MTGDFVKLLEIVSEPVQSSNIAAIGYNAEHSIIHIEFRSGGVYRYLDCSQELFNEFEAAESLGKFFHQKIKDSKAFVKVR